MIWFALFGLLIITVIAASASIGLLLLVALLLLAVLAIAAIFFTRKYFKNRQTDTPYSDSDSMIYPPSQKIGAAPWVMVGAIVGVPLILVLGIFWIRMNAAWQPASQNSQEPSTAAAQLNPMPSTPTEERPDKIPVPVENSKPNSSVAPNEELSFEDLNAELEGSSASLILESIFHAAMKAVQKKWSPVESPLPKEIGPDIKFANPKSSNAIQSFFKGLLPELPKGTNEDEALEAFVQLMGQAIEAKQGKPKWINQPSGFDPQTGVYRTVVTVGPYETSSECTRHRNDKIREAVDKYIEMDPDLGSKAKGRITLSNRQLNTLIKRSHKSVGPFSVGPMVSLHVELVFDRKSQALLIEKFRKSLIYDRIGWSGVALASITLFLLGAFAVLKLDPLYRRRILIAAGVGVAILIGLGLLLIV